MAETDLTQSQADGLSGTSDSGTDLSYPTIGESTYYTTVYRLIHRLLTLAKVPGNSLRVYQDGDLTCGIRAGKVQIGTVTYDYAGCTGQSLTNNQTNYVYLTTSDLSAGNSVTINTTGFPTDGSLVIPLAAIVTSGGTYDYTNITDYRGRGLWRLAGGLKITAGAEAADKRTITIQGGPWRQLVRLWIATSDYGAPSAAGNTVAVETGTQIQQVVANADYFIESDANGTVAIGITISGAASRYIMAEVDGKVYSSGEVTWAA